jgi:DNA-binding MarR family transcriptional regulator
MLSKSLGKKTILADEETLTAERIQRRREAAVRDLKLNLRHFVVELLVSNFEAIADVGLNPTDLGALCLLLLHGPAPAGRLAELTGLTTGAVTGVIDRLEGGGFVRREVDVADRRKVIVVPDPARVDRDLFPHFPSLQRARAATFYDDFSDAELERIAEFLARLTSPDA